MLLLHCDVIELHHIGRMLSHRSRMCDVQAYSLDFQTGNKSLTRPHTRTKTLLSGSQKEKKQNVHLKCVSLNTLDTLYSYVETYSPNGEMTWIYELHAGYPRVMVYV